MGSAVTTYSWRRRRCFCPIAGWMPTGMGSVGGSGRLSSNTAASTRNSVCCVRASKLHPACRLRLPPVRPEAKPDMMSRRKSALKNQPPGRWARRRAWFRDKPHIPALVNPRHTWKMASPASGYGRIDGDNDQRVGNDVALFAQIAAKNKGGGNVTK